MIHNLFEADSEVAMIVYVEIFLFDLVVECFLLIFNFFCLRYLFYLNLKMFVDSIPFYYFLF